MYNWCLQAVSLQDKLLKHSSTANPAISHIAGASNFRNTVKAGSIQGLLNTEDTLQHRDENSFIFLIERSGLVGNAGDQLIMHMVHTISRHYLHKRADVQLQY